jgi:hypothetical protein
MSGLTGLLGSEEGPSLFLSVLSRFKVKADKLQMKSWCLLSSQRWEEI